MSQPASFCRPQLGAAVSELQPSSHILCRVAIPREDTDPEGVGQLVQAFEFTARITGHGGLVTDVVRLTRDPRDSVSVSAILTVSQAVEMLFEESRGEIGGVSPPFTLFADSARPGLGEGGSDPVEDWLSHKDEEARRIGVGRLAELLTRAGFAGEVDRAADELWTRCGY
jgi:hypothetical protein